MENKISQQTQIKKTFGQKLGQTILGFVFAFIVLLALTVGITRVWTWFNINYGARQVRYQESRTQAASPDPYGGDKTAYLTSKHVAQYQPLDLTEDWLFNRDYKPPKILYDPWVPSLEDSFKCMIECDSPPQPPEKDCIDKFEDPVTHDITYKIKPDCECYLKCSCNQSIAPQVTMYDQQIASLRKAAKEMRAQAASMEAKAKDCDDPWDICWWAGFGAIAKKLKEAAYQLRKEAEKICCGWCTKCCPCGGFFCGALCESTCAKCMPDSSAGKLEERKQELMSCCNETTELAQKQCFENITVQACQEIRQAQADEWNDIINDLLREITLSQAMINAITDRVILDATRPRHEQKGCSAWAYYRCKYGSCEEESARSCLCKQQCVDKCDEDCDDYCIAKHTTIDLITGEPVLDEPGYQLCLTKQCGHDIEACFMEGNMMPFFERCYNDCKSTTYATCIGDIGACKDACLTSPQYDAYYQECCQSFCCDESDELECGFGALSARTHDYNFLCWGEWISPGVLGFFGGGDHCNQTWDYRFVYKPAGSLALPDPWPLDPDDPLTDWDHYWWQDAYKYPKACDNMTLWMGRGCTEPHVFCDDDCEYTLPVPPPLQCLAQAKGVDADGDIIFTPCGLTELAKRLPEHIIELEEERDKYLRKINFLNQCCQADWVISPDPEMANLLLGTCCFFNTEFGVVTCLEDETGDPLLITHSGCQLECIHQATLVGETEDIGDIFAECPHCEPIEDPDAQFQCIEECLKVSPHCSEVCSGCAIDKLKKCIDKCMAGVESGC